MQHSLTLETLEFVHLKKKKKKKKLFGTCDLAKKETSWIETQQKGGVITTAANQQFHHFDPVNFL